MTATNPDNSLVLGWGNNEYGQVGIHESYLDNDFDDVDPVFLSPAVVKFFSAISEVDQIACGWNHTVFLLSSGVVYSCGLNDSGQTGQGEKAAVFSPERIEVLEAMNIINVSCGESFTIFLSNSGQVYSCGNNEKGQLGLGVADSSKHSPRQVKFIPNRPIVQISCGKEHTICLSAGGHVFCWGANEFGQLGLGTKEEKVDTPKLLNGLAGFPLYKVVAGGYHSLVLTYSGGLFAWGRNTAGQLGIGDTEDKYHPVKVRSLSGKSVLHVACGEEHTVALTSDGGVFTFGCGTSGQLGHNKFSNEVNPKMVIDLMGSFVTQIACGRKHTLALIGKTGKLYAFGLGVKGQLGLNSSQKYAVPKETETKWQSIDSNYVDFIEKNDINAKKRFYYIEDYEKLKTELQFAASLSQNNLGHSYYLYRIFAGGLTSFAVLVPLNNAKFPSYHASLSRSATLHLSKSLVESMLKNFNESDDSISRRRVIENIAWIFSSRSCLNASFLKRNEHIQTLKTHGLQLLGMRLCLSQLCSIDEIKVAIVKTVENTLIPSMKMNPLIEPEALRVFIILPELPFFDDMSMMWKVLLPYAHAYQQLPDNCKHILENWWSKLPQTFFERLIESFKRGVVKILDQKLPQTANQEIFALHAALRTCMTMLEIFDKINRTSTSDIVPLSTFYIDGLMEKIDMKGDYRNWMQNENIFAFCQYPFALDAKTKSFLLQIDAEIQMKDAFNQTFIMNLTSMVHGTGDQPINPFLVLNIRRDHLVQDTLDEILRHHPYEFKKPLKIKFSDEVAEDAGGVRKEFFLLLMREILDPNYGMFDYYEESRLMWFKVGTFESPEMFLLIGVLCGLAIYNSTIIDLPFPLVLYKKLLNKEESLDDLRELQPLLSRNLQYMLEYTEDDFEEIFPLTFQVTEEQFGQSKSVDLKPNGKNIGITLENREEYVKAYVHYKLTASVYNQFQSFSQGFLRVCGGKVLELCHPQELMEMVVGSQDYDFADLEKVAEYKGEYYRQHPVIDKFWDVFYEFNLEYKKKFLAYLTGSDKVSIQGMRNMKFIIQPVDGGENNEYLPVAHTCFNLLDLPRYETLEKMRIKVRQAIENSQGFGIV